MQLSLKMLSRIANSVDPDQTAPLEQSDLGLHCLHMPFCQTFRCSKFLGHLLYMLNRFIGCVNLAGSKQVTKILT